VLIIKVLIIPVIVYVVIIRLLSWAGKRIDPVGVDYILHKLGFQHARLTIPKWTQRGAMDPLDKIISVLVDRLIMSLREKDEEEADTWNCHIHWSICTCSSAWPFVTYEHISKPQRSILPFCSCLFGRLYCLTLCASMVCANMILSITLVICVKVA